MEQNDRMLLSQALTQAFAEKFEEELAGCGMTAACSEEHTQRMEAMIRRQARSQRRRAVGKWVAAILVAAALLLTAITVGAHYKEIKAFFEKIYEDCIHLTFDDGEQAPEDEGLAVRYTLGYVPEGYTLERMEEDGAETYFKWLNEEGEYLIFKQCVLQGSDAFLDGESGETAIIQWGEYAIYCRAHETNVYSYIWNDGEYAYTLVASKTLTEETLALMLGSIQKAQ